MTTVLGRLSMSSFIHAGAVEMTVVVFLCYGIAVKEGHVKAWLPSISACGELPPEDYVFRYGFVVGACMLAVEAVMVYGANKSFSRSKITLLLSVVAAFALGVIGVVRGTESHLVHDVASYTFFIISDIVMILLTLRSVGGISQWSLAFKITCMVLGPLTTTVKLLADFSPEAVRWLVGADSLRGLALNITEWLNTFIIIIFHWSFAQDLSGYYIAELTEDDGRGGEKRQQKDKMDQE